MIGVRRNEIQGKIAARDFRGLRIDPADWFVPPLVN